MGNDRELTLKVTAKNLTEAELAKVAKGIGSIGGASDKVNKKTSALQRGFSKFTKATPGALKIVAGAATGVAAAVGVATAAVVKLGERGAVVGDVREAFDSLSESAGETGDIMLNELARGVKGTISDFDLMKVANKALGAGLLTSSKDARTMAEGARLLAKRTGGDTAQAFDTLTTSMASGRTAQLKQLGLFVDNKQAVEDFAAATGRSVSDLTDADRAAALQAATMEALRGELEAFAPPARDFGELISAGKVAVGNLVDEVSVLVSNSPVLLAGMRSVGGAIEKAFGSDTQSLAQTVVSIIERGAIVAIQFGQAGITAADFLVRGFAGVKVLFLGIALGASTVTTKLSELVAFTAETAAKVPGLGGAYEQLAIRARTVADVQGAINTSLREQIAEAGAAAAGHGALSQKLGEGRTFLDGMHASMVVATTAQADLNTVVTQGATATGALGQRVVGARGSLVSLTETIEGVAKPKLIEFGAVSKIQSDQIVASTEDQVTALVTYQGSLEETGRVVGGLESAQTAAFRTLGIRTRAELEQTAKEAEIAYQTVLASGLATAAELQKAWEASQAAQRAATGETATFTREAGLQTIATASGQFSQLGGKFKGFAVAEAVISTHLAIVKSLASLPWPASLVAAAGAAAAGFAQVSKIKSQGFRTGTRDLDFQDFGSATPAVLHGQEAVIPRGSTNVLAAEIAAALDRGGRGSHEDVMFEEMVRFLEDFRADIRSFPGEIETAVRNGILLSG